MRITGRKSEARKKVMEKKQMLEREKTGRTSQNKKLKERNPVNRRNNPG